MISTFAIEGASWAATPKLPLNPGLVTIIGARGSGKTALAELVVAGCDAVPLPLDRHKQSFLYRARDFLADATVEVNWASGESDKTTVVDATDEENFQIKRVQYLSQQFVDRLCSSDGVSDELLREVERVVFDSHSISTRDGATDFNELLDLRSSRHREARLRDEVALINLSERIGEEIEKTKSIASIQKQVAEKEQSLARLTNERAALVKKGDATTAARLTAVTAAAEKVRGHVRYFSLQEQQLLTLQDEVSDFRVNQSPEALRRLKAKFGTSGLKDNDWDPFSTDFVGTVTDVIDERLKNARAGSASWKGAKLAPGVPPVPLAADVDLEKQTLARLEAEVIRLGQIINVDKATQEKFGQLAWPILIEQFEAGSRIGHFSHKPRWRPDGHGKGNVVTIGEGNDFIFFAFRLALSWPEHTLHTISALVANLDGLDDALKIEVWDVVDLWAETASEADRASLREAVRVSAFTRRARARETKSKGDASVRAQQTFERLEPRDPVLRHEWLFRKGWIDETADELEEEDLDWQKRDARIALQRIDAIGEVLASDGLDGVLRLAEMGDAKYLVGVILAKALADEATLSHELAKLVEGEPLTGTKAQIVGGALAAAAEAGWNALGPLLSGRPADIAISILLAAPFARATWNEVDTLDLTSEYWSTIEPSWSTSKQDIQTAVAALSAVGRYRAAFAFTRLDQKSLEPQALFSLLQAIVRGSNEAPGTYLLGHHDLHNAFKLLNESGQMSTDEMAGLEFAFIDVFNEDRGEGIVNLERQIEANPELFAEALSFAFKRDDRQADPEDHLTPEERSRRTTMAYKMLEKLRAIPGHDKNGALEAQLIVNWVHRARAACAAIGRVTMGDQTIGKLLSHAVPAEDGTWPCSPVRDALELVLNEEMALGLEVALRNSRGAHWRGEGGGQERALAAKYGSWAKAIEYTHPRLAAALHAVEDGYLREAEREDEAAKIGRRMRF